MYASNSVKIPRSVGPDVALALTKISKIFPRHDELE
jgi:hypothetical protein